MELLEARQLARKLRVIPNITVLGVKGKGEDKTLVLRIGRSKVKTKKADSLGAIAKYAGIQGHAFVKLDLCSLCFREGLRAPDGHYHELTASYGRTSAAAEPYCCRCLEKRGGKEV